MSRPILAKIKFPHEAIILSSVYTILFNLMIKMIIIAVVLTLFQVKFEPGMLLGPPAALSLVLLGTSIGLILTPLGMLYSDVTAGLPVFSQFWFLMTPVVYMLPQDRLSSILRMVNPVTPLLVGVRNLFTKGEMDQLTGFLLVTGIAVILNLVAWLFYRISIPIIVERVSS
jgi:lipopolysaccharide transport system permease protein